MSSLLLSILAFALTISLLVVVHEFGHFWVARLLGIKVLRFSVGFGKSLWRYHGKQGTEYSIAALPLGGYVKMLDEREGPVAPTDLPYAFNRQPVLARIAVVIAGPLFNMLFALLAYWLIYIIGFAVPVPIIGSVKIPSVAHTAKLQSGDEIIAVDGVRTKQWSEVGLAILKRSGEPGQLRMDVKEKATQQQRTHLLDLKIAQSENKIVNPLENLGIVPYYPPLPAVIAAVVANGPAAKAGIKTDDHVLTVNGKKVNNWEAFVKTIQNHPNERVTLEILRGQQQHTIEVIPQLREAENKKIGFLGVQSKPVKWPTELLRKESYSPLGALQVALTQTWKMTHFSIMMLAKLVTGKIAATNVSGPVGIASMAGTSISLGWTAYLSFLALLSINLAILNILPIPLLDGGHLVYYLVELITGKPVSIETQNLAAWLGMILLAGIMLIAFYNDISRLLN